MSEDANLATEQQDTPVDSQAAQQTGQQRVRLRIDERNLETRYANAFRTNTTTEDVFIDFGINSTAPTAGRGGEGQQEVAAEIVFQARDRVILNYYTAKRLAISLGQLVRNYEQRFGELKLNAADRVTNPPQG